MEKPQLITKKDIVYTLVVLTIFTIVFAFFANTVRQNKYISLPEEIQLAEPGDLLFIEQVTKDSIIIGFKH